MKRPFKLSWRHKLEILFDGFTDCKMFETNAEIRESVRRKIYEIELREARRETIDRILPKLEARGIVLPPEIVEEIFGDTSNQKTPNTILPIFQNP